jgi:hypothetical protein
MTDKSDVLLLYPCCLVRWRQDEVRAGGEGWKMVSIIRYVEIAPASMCRRHRQPMDRLSDVTVHLLC